jgi:DNA mismatch repair protein MutS2
VPHLGGRGRVVAAPDRGRVAVQIGALRTTVAVSDVRLAPAASLPRRPEPKQASRPRERASAAAFTGLVEHIDDKAPARTVDATLDLRGSRVDEGLAAVDRFVDDSVMAGREVVFVIHGHGTGALRAAVREHLDRTRAVSRWRPGYPGEGGDGITVAWLDVT